MLPAYQLKHETHVHVKPGDRWLLIGTSGSGKTTAAKMLIRHLAALYKDSAIYIFDGKYDGDFDMYPGRVMQDKAPHAAHITQRYQVWQPIHIIPQEVENWLYQIRQLPPAILYIDELVYLCYGREKYSDEYNIIQKTGRSLPIMCITATQELSHIPANAYKQATHRLGFYIDASAEYDRRLRNNLLKSKLDNPPDLYGFWYQHINGRSEPYYFRNIQNFLNTSNKRS